MRSTSIAVLSLAAMAACGGESTGPVQDPPTESIAGTYAGVIAGTSQGIQVQATFTLTITQSGKGLGGSYGISGTLSDGVQSVSTQGTGILTGNIATGSNPSVNITATSGICSNIRDAFSGAYDSSNRVITINGVISIFDSSCQVILTYPNTTIVLYR